LRGLRSKPISAAESRHSEPPCAGISNFLRRAVSALEWSTCAIAYEARPLRESDDIDSFLGRQSLKRNLFCFCWVLGCASGANL
jgi:hypothetical protein